MKEKRSPNISTNNNTNNTKKSTFNTTNLTYNQKSKSIDKFIPIIDNDEILKEFLSLKNNSKSFGRLINSKRGTLNQSFSKSSKGKGNQASTLIPIRTVKFLKKEDTEKKVNKSHYDTIKRKEKIYYNDIYKSILSYLNFQELRKIKI